MPALNLTSAFDQNDVNVSVTGGVIAEDKVKLEDMVQTPPAAASRVNTEIVQDIKDAKLVSEQVLAEGRLSP